MKKNPRFTVKSVQSFTVKSVQRFTNFKAWPLLLGVFSIALAPGALAGLPSTLAQQTATYAEANFRQAQVEALAELVRFDTRAREGLTPDTDPAFIGFKGALTALATSLGFDVQDHGYVMLIGLGADSLGKKVGVITHGDVQPANPALWPQSPYQLTETSDGKLVARGAEDDKGPIVSALYAMKAIKDQGVALTRRIELMVYLAEESDWDPLKAFLKNYQSADINITLDAEYPVVTGEKGWSQIKLKMPKLAVGSGSEPVLSQFYGGSFASQIPQQAFAQIHHVSESMLASMQAKAADYPALTFDFELDGTTLNLRAHGKAAHSSTPEEGINAVAYLAELLGQQRWPLTTAAATVDFLHSLVGTGLYGERFGTLGYRDDFMGPMTLAPTLIQQSDTGAEITLNLRRPIGRSPEELEEQAHAAIDAWQQRIGIKPTSVDTYWGEPMLVQNAPQVETLLGVFAHYTGERNPKPVAVGGSTNAKLFPNAVSFGPAMPGVEYTGHSEYEFITRAQLDLNLKMYTAALVELARRP